VNVFHSASLKTAAAFAITVWICAFCLCDSSAAHEKNAARRAFAATLLAMLYRLSVIEFSDCFDHGICDSECTVPGSDCYLLTWSASCRSGPEQGGLRFLWPQAMPAVFGTHPGESFRAKSSDNGLSRDPGAFRKHRHRSEREILQPAAFLLFSNVIFVLLCIAYNKGHVLFFITRVLPCRRHIFLYLTAGSLAALRRHLGDTGTVISLGARTC
jgi:hypothetical protein